MRVFAISDLHVDYDANARWIANLSCVEYKDDALIVAGDVTDVSRLLDWCLGILAKRFKKVMFVPGNHELWVLRDQERKHSFQKFHEVRAVVEGAGASTEAYSLEGICLIPLLGWYDYSFGQPSDDLRATWMDFRACRWPGGLAETEIAAHFAAMNDAQPVPPSDIVITYSHFVPRIDAMPSSIPNRYKSLYPVLGSAFLERQLRRFAPKIHVYGHSHVNQRVGINGVSYVNNAFGYVHEWWTSKRLLCIHEC